MKLFRALHTAHNTQHNNVISVLLIMESSSKCGPPPSEATYSDLTTAFSTIQEHAKCNGYAPFKRDVKPSRVVCVCDRYGRPQTKGKDPKIHESRKRQNTGSKKCNCTIKVALEKDNISGSWQLRVL